jgi:hypothetical protein
MPIPPTRPAFVATADPGVAPAAVFVADDTPPSRAELPRLQQVELPRPHAPVRPGGLPSVRPPLKQPGTDLPRTKLSATAPQGPKLARPAAAADPNAPDRPNPPMPPQQPRVYGGAPATRPDAPATRPDAPSPTPASGRLRRKEPESEESAMLGWLDDLLGTQKEEGPRS